MMSSLLPFPAPVSPSSPLTASVPPSCRYAGLTPIQSETKSLPVRVMPTSPATPPSQAHLSPASRDRHLRHLLETHRADRARIQQAHAINAGNDPQMLTDQLHRALQEVRRLDREFQSFQAGANARLARALEENERLRAKLARVDATDEPNSRLVSKTVTIRVNKEENNEIRPSDKTKSGRIMKPSEKELEVERLHQPCEGTPGRSRTWRDTTHAARKSIRMLRRVDPNVHEDADRETKALGRKPKGKENDEGRKSVRLPRSFSRKWSTCF